MADNLNIEETNKIRAALGMPLLPSSNGASNLNFKRSASPLDSGDEKGSTLESRQAAGYDNWKKLQDEADEKKRRETRRDALKKERDAAQRYAKLEGRGLGDANDNLDTRDWLVGKKKREKNIAKDRARRLAEELAARENQAQYTEKDLAGTKVGHELSRFDDAEGEQILTLKDAAIDAEDDDDELENAELREREKNEERLRLKKKKPVYDPNDDTAGGGMLAQYDEEIDGKKQNRFTLDGTGRTTEESVSTSQDGGGQPKGVTISLDFLKEDKPVSDYQDISEIKVRKPKKKKEKSKRKRQADDEDDVQWNVSNGGPPPNDSAMDLEMPEQTAASRKRSHDNMNFVDDEDLQFNLATQRRTALKKRKLDRPEDIARRLLEEASATPGVIEATEQPEEEGGLIIDETSEFLSNLQRSTAPEQVRKHKALTPAAAESEAQYPTAESPDVKMQSPEGEENEEDTETHARRATSQLSDPGMTATGLDEEETLDKGIGATLAMLTGRGIIKTAASGDISAVYRERQRFLADKQKREAEAERKARLQRERDRASGKFERMSAREREQYAQWENKQRDQLESRQLADLFNKEYKPNVELNYLDEFGRHMKVKEAFKDMSHQFHGKGSGKQKTEKKLKKIEDEKKWEAASTLDTSATGMNNAAGETARKNRQAGVRLQ